MKKLTRHKSLQAACLVLLLVLLAACNKYIVYKAVMRKPEKTKAKLIHYIKRHKEFVLSVKGTEFKLSRIVIDDQAGSVKSQVVSMEGVAGPYHPEDPRLAGTRHPKGKWDRQKGEGRIFNQVFLVADTLIRIDDRVEIPLSSIRRIDEAQKLTADSWACFIATACYGDYNAPEVRLFRQYRDEVLRKTVAGKILVRLYYVLSPPAARLLNRWEWGRRQVRCCILEPLARQIAAKQRCGNNFIGKQRAAGAQAIL